MSRRLARPSWRIICQINGEFDEARGTRLPAQCCGMAADQIWKCEQIAPPGHPCQVGDHTILHERMGNGYPCSQVENRRLHGGGMSGLIRDRAAAWTVIR